MALLGNAASGNAILAQDLLAGVVAQSYLISGTTPSTSANLTLTYASQEAVVTTTSLAQYVKLAASTLAITASKDAYIDLGYSGTYNGGTANGTLTKVEVANGAAAPAVTANSIRLWKVVSSGTALTAVTLLATVQPVSGTMVQTGGASGVAGLTAQKVLDLSSAGTPSVAGAGAQGAGASIALASGSTDARGVVNMTTGTGTSAGSYWTLTFSTPLTRTPVVLLSFTGPNTSSAPVAASVSTTGFTMVNATMAASTAFNVAYLVVT